MTAVTDPQATTVPPAPKPRVAFIDNARFWVMLMVVITHPLFHFITLESGRAIYYWLNLLMMPAFAILSGYVSRNFRGTPKEIQRTVSTLVIPYLLVESTYQVLQRHYTGSPDPYVLLSPKWVAWWLAALFVWRMSTPIWRHLRHPILVSIVISLLAPLTEIPNVIGMPKALGFLPFYVIGMYMTIDRFERLAATRVRIASALFLAGVAAACALYSSGWDVSWTKWRHRYDEAALDVGPIDGITTRAMLLVVGLLMSLAVVSLVSRRASWMTRFGERTLYCYLLHGFVVLFLLHETNLFPTLRALGDLGVLITVAGAIVLGLLLMTKPVAVLFRPLFESNLDWAFRPRESLPR
ncbi:MAG TPA: acyltransferase family protein [Aeromicrobium sp.]|nr:acyltransferase family protein [Aeromicrobium sp.]